MARGKHNNQSSNRGSRGGYRGGRGGGGRGRGRGQGDFDDDFSIYDWANTAMRGGGANTPNFRGRGRGRGGSGFDTPRGGPSTPNRGFGTPRGRGRPQYNTNYDDVDPGMGRGRGSPVDRGRGRGRGAKNLTSRLRAGAPLSKMLYEDRPLLRPIVFVRSVYTATLFEDEEDVFKPLAEDVANDEESHAPTAAQVDRVFHTTEDDEEIEEIDFSQVGRVQAEVDAAAAAAAATQEEVTIVEEKFIGFYIDTQPAPVFPVATRDMREVLGEDDDEEVIVYVAPHPRAGPATPPSEQHPPEVLPTAPTPTGLTPLESVPAETEAVPPVVDASWPVAKELPINVDEVHQSQAEDSGGRSEIQMTETDMEVEAELSNVDSSIPAVTSELIPAAEDASLELAADTLHVLPETPRPTAPPETPATTESAPEPHIEHLAPAVEQPAATSAPSTPAAAPVAVEDVAFTFSQKTTQKKLTRRLHPVRTPRSLIKTKTKTRRKPLRGFSSFGASLAEAQLHEKDPRKDERREGDSDLDWGDDESDAAGKDPIEELSNGVGDMQVDDGLDIEALKSFVKSMGAEGSRTVTMDDIADEERLRREDAEDSGGAEGSSAGEDSGEEDSEIEEIVRKEEEMLIAEGIEIAQLEGSDEEDEVSSDDEFDDSPRRGFQARLQRIRENAKGKGKAKAVNPPESDEDDDDDDDEMQLEQTWADGDDDFIAHIQDLVDEGQEILSRKDRKQRNKLFRSIQDGDIDLDEYEEMMGRPAPRKKDKPAHIPPELQAQWESDRAKKAENKRLRALQRMQAAADPLTPKKGGKKGMKAMLTAARYSGPEELPNRVTDLVSLEAQIRRFIEDVGATSMTLPPADKGTRKRVHELAEAFSLKSQSKGSGNKRYTTLTKTSMSGLKVNERKVKRIMKDSGAWDWQSPAGGGQGGKKMSLAKHKEGEEVGKAAPKLTEANIGFKMLASMGWAEGDRIGLSGGLDVPLVAKMKKTKLGLGASIV